jgi:hypothetical protein
MKRTLKLTLFAGFFSLCSAISNAQTSYEPQIDGTIRAKYEYNTNDASIDFRYVTHDSASENFSPILNYKAESIFRTRELLKCSTLSSPTTFKMVAFYNRSAKSAFQTDYLRSPHQLYFANRSFIGKHLPD